MYGQQPHGLPRPGAIIQRRPGTLAAFLIVTRVTGPADDPVTTAAVGGFAHHGARPRAGHRLPGRTLPDPR